MNSTAVAVDTTEFTYPGDEKHNFAEGPSVAFWQEYKAPASSGLENLREATTKALREAGAGSDAFRYWSYHLARATFFAGQAAAGVVAYQASAAAARSSGDMLEQPSEADGEPTVPKMALSDLPTLVDTMGSLYAEAIATWEQDFGEVSKGTFRLPWDMVDERNRQRDPFYIADQGRRFLQESVAVLTRRNRRDPKDFGVWMEDPENDEYPSYYLNNFHFQSDGWMSTDSAKVYETSTETLFLGRQDSMQRLSLYPLASWTKANGAPNSLLEVACGTGRQNTFIRDNYPKTSMTACDLSPYYVQEARENAKRWEAFHKRESRGSAAGPLHLAQANAEKLPYKDASFDVVVNVYLFHELPHEARAAAAREMARTVKPGGLVVWVDSVQSGDRPDLDANLGNFQYLNEPHYPTYISEDVGQLFIDAGLKPYEKHVSSTSKCLAFTKPTEDSSVTASQQVPGLY